MTRGQKKRLCDTLIIIPMILIGVLFLMPYVWMLLNSVKDKVEIMKARTFWPSKFVVQNYITVITGTPIFYWFKNSVVVTVVSTVLTLFTSSLAGFVFAKYEFKGKAFVFMFILATMMVPGQVTMIPSFLIIDKLHMYDTLAALIVPGMVGGFGIFLCRQFIEDVPTALCEAASIDGASDMFIYTRIIIPLIRPALGALAIFTFLGKWNDYLGPLLYLSDPKNMTMPLAINFFSTKNTADVGATMAAAVLVTLPVTIFYLCLQKQFIKGIAITGMK